MKDRDKPELLIHMDVDSPLKLLDFYKISNAKYELCELESFYETFLNRALEFFEKYNIKVSFFMVGNELETSEKIKKLVFKTHELGHEIENHSYSHPFGFATLSNEEITKEITECSDIIYRITGEKPVGFRAPGYSIDTNVIKILKNCGLKYDSSGFWSIMNPILEYGHKLMFKNGLKNEGFGYVTSRIPHEPYPTDLNDWLKKNLSSKEFWEIPLPRTKFSGLPFYNNINLWAPEFYSYLISKFIKRKHMVYLFHAIEFIDLSDSIPVELSIHPNIKIPVSKKMERSGKIINKLLERYNPVSTRRLIDKLSKGMN
jgi:peptidoglycan-N-acetylglucosamine deacetylase